jgi:Tol biopolymer transport system component
MLGVPRKVLLAHPLLILLLALVAVWLLKTAAAQAAFPGENGRIAFVSDRDGDEEIYSMNPDGSDVRKLTDNAANDSGPAVSADGRRIVFTSYRDDSYGDIYLMNADGSRVRRLTKRPTEDFDPSFSPDGNTIVFNTKIGGEYAIYTMSAADGSGLRPVVAGGTFWPSFSPDGTKVLYTADRGLGRTTAYTVDPDGTHGAILFAYVTEVDSPSYSPDGERILFDSSTDVYLRGASGVTLLTGGVMSNSASFSPDGTRITFQSHPLASGNYEIYTMNADGTMQTNRTNARAEDTDPVWMPASPYDDATRPELGLGTPQLQKRKGTAIVPVSISRKGKLSISGSGVTAEQRNLAAAGSTTIALRATGKARKKLRLKGKATVTLAVTYTAEIGDPISKSVAVKLVKAKKRKHR